MKLRTIGLIATLTLSVLSAPLASDAQQTAKVPRIGHLAFPCTRPGLADPLTFTQPFRQALRELGYVEGQNIAEVVPRCANKSDLLFDLAADLVRVQQAAVLIVIGTEAIQAAKQATNTIPILMVSVSDPVGLGLVPNLARPGGNVTGVSLMSSELGPKRLELLKEVAPRASRVVVLWNSADSGAAREWRETQAAAQALGVSLKSVEVRGPDDFDGAFRAMTDLRVGGLVTLLDTLTFAHRAQIAKFATKRRLPSTYGLSPFVEAGGLMAYGASVADVPRRLAVYVDKILKGAKPGDLPVEQPTKFELAINLKTAKALGLTIPQSVLFRADHVIQ